MPKKTHAKSGVWYPTKNNDHSKRKARSATLLPHRRCLVFAREDDQQSCLLAASRRLSKKTDNKPPAHRAGEDAQGVRLITYATKMEASLYDGWCRGCWCLLVWWLLRLLVLAHPVVAVVVGACSSGGCCKDFVMSNPTVILLWVVFHTSWLNFFEN